MCSKILEQMEMWSEFYISRFSVLLVNYRKFHTFYLLQLVYIIVSRTNWVHNNICNPQSSKSQQLLLATDSKDSNYIPHIILRQTCTSQSANLSTVLQLRDEQNVWNANDDQTYLKGHCRKIASYMLNNTCLDLQGGHVGEASVDLI